MQGNKKEEKKFIFVDEEKTETTEEHKKENNTHVNIKTLMKDSGEDTNTQLFNTTEMAIIQENLKNEKEESKIMNKFYFGYKFRVGFLIALVLLFFISGYCCIMKALNETKASNIEYVENADATYKVCMRQDDPYLTNCIDYSNQLDMKDTVSLNVNFEYLAQLQADANVNLVYHVMAVNRIYDKFDSSKVLYENEDLLLREEPIEFINLKTDTESEFTVDIKKYNDFVLDYQNKYPYSSEASLEIIASVTDGVNDYDVGTINIPLGVEKLVIFKNFVKQETRSTEVFEKDWSYVSTIYIVIGSLLIISSIIAMVFLTKFVQKTLNKKSKYERTLQDFLTTYDRIIVEARGGYESDIIKKVVKVPNFNELLDAHEVLNKPIIYSRVNNIKSEFIVEDEDKIYKFVLKEADLEKEGI